MKKLLILLTVLMINISISAQSSQEIVRELQNTFVNYNVCPFGASWWKVITTNINYDAPLMTIKMTLEHKSDGHTWTSYLTYKFDVLKAYYGQESYSYNGKPSFQISCSTGIDV